MGRAVGACMEVQVVNGAYGADQHQRNGDRWHPGSVERVRLPLFEHHTPRIGRVLRPSGRLVPSAKVAKSHGTKSPYLKAYTRATDEDIKAGYILPADKAQVLAFAKHSGPVLTAGRWLTARQ